MEHFGHFLLETIPTLWAYEGAAPVVFHKLDSKEPDAIKLEMLDLANVQGDPIFIKEPTRTEEMVVPSRPVVLNAWCTEMAVRQWERMAIRVLREQSMRPGGGERVWLSRSQAEKGDGASRRIGHDEFDQIFEDLGFTIVYPEQHTFREQILMARSASIIAGFEGSALHLSAFSAGGTRVMTLGSQARPKGNLAQMTIDRAVGNWSAMVEYDDMSVMARQVERLVSQEAIFEAN